jgi:predicted GTPase
VNVSIGYRHGGRDFHNFNVAYRAGTGSEVVAFTVAQIPGIDVRALRNRGAAAVVTLIEDHESRLLQVEWLSAAVRDARPGVVEAPEQETWVLGLKAPSFVPDGAGNEVA